MGPSSSMVEVRNAYNILLEYLKVRAISIDSKIILI
jgi:hypothetical protein